MPWWLTVLCAVSMMYAICNFGINIGLMEGGNPSIEDGQYLLMNQVEIIRKLTKNEYLWAKAYETRLFSGHWMIFYLLSGTLLISRIKSVKSNNR